MTPQERQLVDDLFDRLAQLESAPRDAEAERAIIDGLRRAPNAVYALVQTALVQDEALKRANARIEELQAGGGAPEQPRGFLDSMRAAFGAPRGSVPSVRPPDQAGPAYPASPPGFPPQMPPGYGYGSGSFLGNAASAAAGVIGGALLLDGIRSMFGHHGGFGQSAFGDFGDRSPDRSPWGGTAGSAADSSLARDAGIDHIGSAAHHDGGAAHHDGGAQPFAGDQNASDEQQDYEQDLADDSGDDFGDDSFGGFGDDA
jgi:hypothetical protein